MCFVVSQSFLEWLEAVFCLFVFPEKYTSYWLKPVWGKRGGLDSKSPACALAAKTSVLSLDQPIPPCLSSSAFTPLPCICQCEGSAPLWSSKEGSVVCLQPWPSERCELIPKRAQEIVGGAEGTVGGDWACLILLIAYCW